VHDLDFGILPDIAEPETSTAVTPTEAIAAPSPTTEQEISPPTESSPPVTTSEPTVTVIPTEPPPPRSGLQVYDTFDDACISKNTWGMFVDSQATPIFLPTPVGQCWELEQGLSKSSGRLTFDYTTAADEARSFYLVEVSEQTVTAVALDLTVESTSGQWAGVGLFTRLNDADRSWVYYFLRLGGDLPIGQGRVITRTQAGNKPKERQYSRFQLWRR